jgi:hypothetical protein
MVNIKSTLTIIATATIFVYAMLLHPSFAPLPVSGSRLALFFSQIA